MSLLRRLHDRPLSHRNLLAASLFAFLLAGLAGALPARAQAPYTILTATGDAYTQNDPSTLTTNFGSSSQIVVTQAMPRCIGYLKFPTSGLTGYVTSATLRMYGSYTGTDPQSIASVSAVPNAGWDESKVTWNHHPVMGSIIGYNIVRALPAYTIDFDVTSWVQSQVASGQSVVSFALQMVKTPSDGKTDVFNSREAGSNAPMLIITFGNPPTVNVNFQPAASPIPLGFFADIGRPYSQDLGYGWVEQDSLSDDSGSHAPLDLTPNTFDRAVSGLDPARDTVLAMQYPQDTAAYPSDTAQRTPGAWEFAVPQGEYSVSVEVGDQPDPTHGFDSINQINIEGTHTINGYVGTLRYPYRRSSHTVTVNDGRLTVDAIGGTNTKIDDLSITPVTIRGVPVPTNITWGTAAPLPIILSETAHELVDGKLYIFGGYRDPSLAPSPAISVYDPSTDSWSSLPDMPEGLTHTGEAMVGRDIYFAGGYTGQGGAKQTFALTDVWKYNVDTQEWSAMPPLPDARGAGAMVYVDGKLHYFGGCDITRTDQRTHWVLPLDGSATQWTEAAPVPTPHNHMGAVVLDGKIYAIGGQVGQDNAEIPQSAVQVYDPTTDTWNYAAGLPRARSHIAGSTFTMDNRIIVEGGETDPNVPISDCSAYDPMTNTWTNLSPLPDRHRSGFGALIDGKIYYGGGGGNNYTLNVGTLSYAPTSTSPAPRIDLGDGPVSAKAAAASTPVSCCM